MKLWNIWGLVTAHITNLTNKLQIYIYIYLKNFMYTVYKLLLFKDFF